MRLRYSAEGRLELKRLSARSGDVWVRRLQGVTKAALDQLAGHRRIHGAWRREPGPLFAGIVAVRPFSVYYLFYVLPEDGSPVLLLIWEAPQSTTQSVAPIPEPPDAAWLLAAERFYRGGW